MRSFKDIIVDFFKGNTQKTGKRFTDNFFESLPDENILPLLKYLIKTPRDLIAFSLVDQRIKNLCLDAGLWKTIGFSSPEQYLRFSINSVAEKGAFKIALVGVFKDDKTRESVKNEFVAYLKKANLSQARILIDYIEIKIAQFKFGIWDTPCIENAQRNRDIVMSKADFVFAFSNDGQDVGKLLAQINLNKRDLSLRYAFLLPDNISYEHRKKFEDTLKENIASDKLVVVTYSPDELRYLHENLLMKATEPLLPVLSRARKSLEASEVVKQTRPP